MKLGHSGWFIRGKGKELSAVRSPPRWGVPVGRGFRQIAARCGDIEMKSSVRVSGNSRSFSTAVQRNFRAADWLASDAVGDDSIDGAGEGLKCKGRPGGLP